MKLFILNYRNLNFSLYARQFQNKENWFNGFGLGFYSFEPHERFSISLEVHYWQQPEDFNFNTSESFDGGAIDTELKYSFPIDPASFVEAVSVHLGILYKSKGFLPEELELDENFGLRLETSLKI